MGRKRKNWKSFELRIENEVCFTKEKSAIIRIPEEVRNLYGKRPVQVKGEVDFIAVVENRPVMFDAKSTEERLWNIKEHCMGPKKFHQYMKLREWDKKGLLSGYLIHFRDYHLISWVPISWVYECYTKDVKSIHPEQPGVHSQSEDDPLDLSGLVFGFKAVPVEK